MITFYLYWESDVGLECFTCAAHSEYGARKKARLHNPEIIDCLVEIQRGLL